MTRRAPLAAVALAALGVAAPMPGCRGGGEGGAPPVPAGAEPAPRERAGALDVRLWSLTAGSEALGRALAPFAETEQRAVPVALRDRWRRAGFRLVEIPSDALPALAADLGLTAASRGRAVEDPSAWISLVRGAEAPVWHLNDGSSPVRLGPGALRLLARGWPTPAPRMETPARTEAAFLIEMIPQHHDAPSPLSRVGLGDYARLTGPPLLEEGLLFRDLHLRALLDADRTLLIIPESPNADWTSRAAADDTGSGGDEAGNVDGTVELFPGMGVGGGPVAPRAFGGVPVGVGMLCERPDAALAGAAPRAVVVITPGLPSRFSLFSPTRAGRGR